MKFGFYLIIILITPVINIKFTQAQNSSTDSLPYMLKNSGNAKDSINAFLEYGKKFEQSIPDSAVKKMILLK